VVIDYSREMVILAVLQQEEIEEVVGVGQYGIDETTHSAEVAFAVRDDRQGQGIGSELLSYLTVLAKRQGLLGFTAEVLFENRPMMQVFERAGFDLEKKSTQGVFELKMTFRETG
jgi:GNAT superfamily N-acetyltransferase